MAVDLEIRMEDHLLSWKLFCRNVGEIMHSSRIRRIAVPVVEKCGGHLLAIIRMAKALREVESVHNWEYASQALDLETPAHMKDKVLFNVLSFIWMSSGSAKDCVKHCALYMEREGTDKVHLIQMWITDRLIRSVDEGEKLIQYLVNSFVLESFHNGASVRMKDEIREELVNLIKPEISPPFLRLGGQGLTEPPIDEAWKEAKEMHLMDNELSKLPERPDCPQLTVLFLQTNHHLRVIPPLFFQHMPLLQILDLSNAKIRYLPQSLSKLVELRKLFLRGCELFIELPPEVGELSNLEVLDLEETEIISLPVEVGKLTNLKCLEVSLCRYSNRIRRNNQSNSMIPQKLISNLSQLEEISINVDPDDDQWNVAVKDIVKEVCSLRQLKVLKLNLPKVVLLNDFVSHGTSPPYLSMYFRFNIGSLLKRIISRLPRELVVKFEQEERCLAYMNGEGAPIEIKEVLQHSTALFLDHHLTVTKLSEFGIGNMKKPEFCVLWECNELQTIMDGAEIYKQGDGGEHNEGDVNEDTVTMSFRYSGIHYMKNLECIWKGPVHKGSLSNLKSLVLCSCPRLTTIFTLKLLENLNILEELVIEDCPEINSLVTCEFGVENEWFKVVYLPSLKKMSLHYMPKLVSISRGIRIAPKLEWLSLYDCPRLEALSPMEVSSNNLKVIIGDSDWWNALTWSESDWGCARPDNLDSVFVPINRDVDLITQLSEIAKQLQTPGP